MSYQRAQIASVHFPTFKRELPSMAGRTVAITGTTSGTGFVAARTVAELGGRVVLLNRPSVRAEQSLEALGTACPEAELHSVACDLQSFDSVRRACEQVRDLCADGLHVLCNNAGVMALEDAATEDGFDVQMQTNHLSHFLLTHELMPLLERAAEATGDARVVNHSSVARMSPKKTLLAPYLEPRGGDLGGNGGSMFFLGARWVRYNQSKLANCAFTAALHDRFGRQGSKVRALVAHPGLAATDLQVTTTRAGGMLHGFTGLFMRMAQSPEDGAMGILTCICKPEAQSGSFYGPGSGNFAMRGPAQRFALEPFYDNPETRELLWSKSCDAVGIETS